MIYVTKIEEITTPTFFHERKKKKKKKKFKKSMTKHLHQAIRFHGTLLNSIGKVLYRSALAEGYKITHSGLFVTDFTWMSIESHNSQFCSSSFRH